jgi:hypothetical protein
VPLLLSLLFAFGVFTGGSLAQGGQKKSRWTYPANPGDPKVRAYSLRGIDGIWRLKDFGAAALNPNTSQMTPDAGQISVEFKVTADDPLFQFCPGGPGTCDIGPRILNKRDPARNPPPEPIVIPAYSDGERNITRDINTPTTLFPPTNFDEPQYDFTGTVEVYSCDNIDKNKLCDTGLPKPLFYSQNVYNLTTPEGQSAVNRAEAFQNAWQQYDAFTDVFWNPDLKRHLAIFANFFHNLSDWPYGWQTTLSVDNQSGRNIDYTVVNHLRAGRHAHAPGCVTGDEYWLKQVIPSNPAEEKTLSKTVFVRTSFPSGPTVIDPFRDLTTHKNPDASPKEINPQDPLYWEADTSLSMEIVGYQPGWEVGINPSMHIFSNTTNNEACIKAKDLRNWFLAEGSTLGFAAYVLIQNPNTIPITEDVLVDVTFFKQDGTTVSPPDLNPLTVAAQTRRTVAIHGYLPNTASVSTRVKARDPVPPPPPETPPLPIFVERAMYFNGGQAGTASVGSKAPRKTWYFPSNRTFAGDEDFILMVNQGASAATVTATYIFENQAPSVQTYTVGANSRFTIAVHGIFPGTRVSVSLQSTLPIAAERAFYINNRAGGSAEIGAISASRSWYFAEGDTSNLTTPDFNPAITQLELFNPGDDFATITVNYMLETGTVISRTYTLAGKRRTTINAANDVGTGVRFSMEVLSDSPIVAGRLMFSGNEVGDSIGSPTTGFRWNLAEGFTAFGYETWIIISNPGTQTANITVSFIRESGPPAVNQNYTLGAKQRLTVPANSIIPGASISTTVTSDQPIVVERTMKFENRQGMHQSMGIPQYP